MSRPRKTSSSGRVNGGQSLQLLSATATFIASRHESRKAKGKKASPKAESASARGLHRLKGLPLASAVGGRAWGVALGVSSVLEGYLEDWVRRAPFTVTLYRSGLRSVTYVSKFCKPLDFKQSDYIFANIPPIPKRRYSFFQVISTTYMRILTTK
jgi:hypothetical protein